LIPTQVHLVGSIGLDSVKDVFRTVGPLLGNRLRRIPDGVKPSETKFAELGYAHKAHATVSSDPKGSRGR
jgi:hypothetical protein